jgi:hypothetical protein
MCQLCRMLRVDIDSQVGKYFSAGPIVIQPKNPIVPRKNHPRSVPMKYHGRDDIKRVPACRLRDQKYKILEESFDWTKLGPRWSWAVQGESDEIVLTWKPISCRAMPPYVGKTFERISLDEEDIHYKYGTAYVLDFEDAL